MNVRDRLFRRTLVALYAATLALLLVEIVVPAFRGWVPLAGYYGALFTVAALLVRAGRLAAARIVAVVFGMAPFLGVVWADGGVESRFAPYLVLAGIASWAWLGPVGGVAGSLAAAASLVSPFPPSPQSDAELVAVNLLSLLLAAAFVGSVMRDLRAAARLSHTRAERAERAAALASADDEARDRFLEMVSHELRTPLDVVLGYAALLREEEVDDDRARDLDRIGAAGRQLLSLLDDVLDMSRLQADEFSVRCEPLALGALVEEVVETVAPMAAARADVLHVHVAPELPLLASDSRRIRQILLNLVSNSAKYTSNGEIRVVVEVHGATVRLMVRDTGIGIPRNRLDQLFQPFVQLHDGPDRRPGIGLGLALSQRLAQRLGGRIEVRSEIGVGSTFTLVLPIRTSAEPEAVPAPAST